MLISVAETPEYLRRAERLLDPGARVEVVDWLAARPRAGDLIPGTGGVRKVRWGRRGSGKRGGVRVIYYYHSASMPLYLLTVFAKNERADLGQSERADLAKLVGVLKMQSWRSE